MRFKLISTGNCSFSVVLADVRSAKQLHRAGIGRSGINFKRICYFKNKGKDSCLFLMWRGRTWTWWKNRKRNFKNFFT